MTTLKKTLQQLTLAAAVSAVAGVAVAATQGTVGQGSSQGDFDVTLNKDDQIVINNFRDMVLAEFIEAGGDYVGAQNLCVGREGAAGGSAESYAITASNQKASFALNNGDDPTVAQNNIRYNVFFNNEVNGVQQFAEGTELLHSVQNNDDFNTEFNVADCGVANASNSTIWVRALSTDITGANTGTFTDTVTVTVAVN